MDINLDLGMSCPENSTHLSSDLLVPNEKEIHSALMQEVITDDDALDMEDEVCLYGIDSLPLYKRAKSFPIPISSDTRKKKKKFKKERRYSKCARLAQERRKSNLSWKTQFYINGDMDIEDYQETLPSGVRVML